MTDFRIPLAAMALLLGASPALAHVVATTKTAPTGSYSVVGFRIGHGCQGSATTTLRVEIPEAIHSAKPQPKPGWTIEVATTPAADGKPRPTAVTWRGRLPDDQFDDFNLLLVMPAEAGPLYFPAVQTCETGEARWTQIPAAPDMTGLEHPAPTVMVTPADAAPEHNHH